MGERIRVLIVDDHPLMRQALIRMLHGQSDIEVVGEACDGIEAVDKSLMLSPDVIIMDLGMPRMNGIQATSEITHTQSKARIIVFSGMEDADSVLKAVQAGAIAFLEKSNPEVDIARAIRETHQGLTTLKGDTLVRLVNHAQHKPEITFYSDILPKREMEIALMLGNGYTDQKIGEVLLLPGETIKNHIHHILSILNLKSQAELIRFVIRGGLEEKILK